MRDTPRPSRRGPGAGPTRSGRAGATSRLDWTRRAQGTPQRPGFGGIPPLRLFVVERMGMFFHDRGETPPERPADPEVRRANLRRIGRLFKPYWRRLSLLLGLIVVSAGLGVIPAFLLRRVLIAIEAHDTRAVSL